MGTKTKALYQELLNMMREERNRPKERNLVQERLDANTMKGLDFLEGRDYRDLSKAGAFFDFEAPATQLERYRNLTNASQTGNFALGDNGANTQSMALAKNYLNDKFARDVGQNFQQNISNASGLVRTGALQSSDARAQDISAENARRMGLIKAFGDLYHTQKSTAGPGLGAALLGAGASVASSAITKW